MANELGIILVVLIILTQVKQFHLTSETNVGVREERVLEDLKEQLLNGVVYPMALALSRLTDLLTQPKNIGIDVLNEFRSELSEISNSKLRQITEVQKKYQEVGKDISSCVEKHIDKIKESPTHAISVVTKCVDKQVGQAINIITSGIQNIKASQARVNQYLTEIEECGKLSFHANVPCVASMRAKVSVALTDIPQELLIVQNEVTTYMSTFKLTAATCPIAESSAFALKLGGIVSEVMYCSLLMFPNTGSVWRDYRIGLNVNAAPEPLHLTELLILFVSVIYL